MNNLKGHFVLIGVAVVGVALILVAILMPPGEVPLPEDAQETAQGEVSETGTTDTGDQATPAPQIEPADEPAHVRLLRAAAAGDVATIENLTGMGVRADAAASQADVDAMTSPQLEVGMTALMVAARDGDERTVMALLEAGADPNLQSISGMTPLTQAAQRAESDIVVTLLGAGADPSLQDDRGRTALIHAARSGAYGSAGLLLEAGAEVDHADDEGATALMHAAGAQHLEAVLVLLGGGANVEAVDASGRGAMDRAGSSGPIADMLREAAGG